MSNLRWLKIPAALLALALAIVLSPAQPARAQPGPELPDLDLAARYAPVLYFHPDELYRPQPVEVMIGVARLRQARSLWADATVLRRVEPSDLERYTDSSYSLDVWLGDQVSSDHRNYSAHRGFYASSLSPEAGGPPPLTYAHVVRDQESRRVTIQYWLFYLYNDFFNKHEGDWEMVQVVLDPAGRPEWLVLSQHEGGTRRAWDEVTIEEDTHPVVYVALGSHANYFWGNEIYINRLAFGNAHLDIPDRTGTVGRTVPRVVALPDREEVEADPSGWGGMEWLLFRGRWGETAPRGEFRGPVGPADKGEQWERPLAWALAQPLDTDIWYANRLRVGVSVRPGESAWVMLRSGGNARLPPVETLGGLALLHDDPAPETAILATIEGNPFQRYDVVANWPDAESSRVTSYLFDGVQLGDEGRALLSLTADGSPMLTVGGTPYHLDDLPAAGEGRIEPPAGPGGLPAATVARAVQAFRPTWRKVMSATWDAPDVIWAVGRLPASDVARGVILSVLAGLLPALFFVALLYWVDQYEKEPIPLLAAAFLWGALPALLVAIAVRVFFRLPVGLAGPRTVELVSAGLVSPLVEQALTGGALLFVAWRHRREFDDVLDGILYGAVVGLGFAMAGNTASYLGAFLQYGLPGLGHAATVDGVLYGLNQALYGAIFGAGLGYARWARRRWLRWAAPVAGFVLAVATRAFHNLAIDSTVGWNLGTVAVTWAGLLVMAAVMAWSLRQQRRCLMAELAGEVPEAIRGCLTRPAGWWRAEWRALWRGGPRGLLRVRRAFEACATLAYKKAQGRQLGDRVAAAEVARLRKEAQAAVDGVVLGLLA